jgi:hypothetical protein
MGIIRVVDEDDTSCVVPKVQVWACKPMFPSPDFPYKSIDDFDYVHGTSFGILESNIKLDNKVIPH